MSQPPPNLPEPQSQPLRPNDGEQYEYLTIEEEISTADRGGRGCLRGVLGLAGCTLLISVLCVGTIFVSGRSIQGLLSSWPHVTVPNVFGWVGWASPAAPQGIYVPEVERVRQLSQLTTVRYNYSNIITSEIDMPDVLERLYGNQQVMVAVGHIRAGIDAGQITDDSIIYDPTTNTLTLQLPPPQLQECFLNENESYIVERRSGIFAAPAPDLDTESRRFAVEQYRNQALEDGILQDAADEAERIMREFLQTVTVGETEIVITVAPETGDRALPDTCE